MRLTVTLRAGILMVPLLAGGLAMAQQAPTPAAPGQRGAGRGAQGPRVVSPEILPDKKVTFRLLAPEAVKVC